MKINKPQRRVLRALMDAGGTLTWWSYEAGGLPAIRTLDMLIDRGWIEQVIPEGGGMMKWRLTEAGIAVIEGESDGIE